MKDFLKTHCTLRAIKEENAKSYNPLRCGDSELDDFFANDAVNYDRQLLGKSYLYALNENPKNVVCAFTLANSSVDAHNLPNSRRKKLTHNIPYEKLHGIYPAALIGRLAVSSAYQGKGIGREMLDFIKLWAIEPGNRMACRFIKVDAYNNASALKFYRDNDFNYLFSTEQQEKQYMSLPHEYVLKTRLMYFDLIQM